MIDKYNECNVDKDKHLLYKEVINTKIVNGKTVFNCTRCGDCCYIREKDKGISCEEESQYNNYMFRNFGIIYLAALTDITINVWPEEAERLKIEAENQRIKINIVPKRAVYDSLHHELIILDYYIDHDICPFFDAKTKSCKVYDIRPIICRSYPLLSTKNLGKCKYKLSDPNKYYSERLSADKLETMIITQKKILQSAIDKGDIIVLKQISEHQFDNIIKTARYKELRIMKDVLNDSAS